MSLIQASQRVRESFTTFKQREAKGNGAYAEVILGLEIADIDFWSPEHPNAAEVSFTTESDGQAWTCLLVDGEFQGPADGVLAALGTFHSRRAIRDRVIGGPPEGLAPRGNVGSKLPVFWHHSASCRCGGGQLP